MEKQDIINLAKNETKYRFSDEGQSFTNQQKLALTCRILFEAGHSQNDGLAGQVTMRGINTSEPSIWTQGFGFGLEETKASDYLLVNKQLEVLEGKEKPNKANRFHFHIYDCRKDINCIIHTHAPYCSILGGLHEAINIQHMDSMGIFEDCAHLFSWPGVPFSDEEGRIISNALGLKNCVLLAHHGLLTVGKTIEQACYRAIVLEKAAEQQVKSMWTGKKMAKVCFEKARQAKDWKVSDGPLMARYYYWARRCMPRHQDCLN